MAREGGPHLAMAVICERVLEEKDGVLTAVRIIDRLMQSAVGQGVPTEMPAFTRPITILIAFRADRARGRYKVRVRPELPGGTQLPVFELPVHFEGEERGANIVVNTELAFQLEGLYWFDVFFEEELVTRIPLRVMYQPQPVPGQPES